MIISFFYALQSAEDAWLYVTTAQNLSQALLKTTLISKERYSFMSLIWNICIKNINENKFIP